MQLALASVAKILGSSWRGEELLSTGISTDSRSTNRGDIFIAITGENFDGHEFISQAKNRGAIASIVSKVDCVEPVIQVPDTIKALASLARHWHKVCDTSTIAITGSVGKTTVKEMLAIMIASEFELCVTRGNYNNHIGLPLTIFNEKKQHQFSVFEMGANAKNDISDLCDIAKPQVGIITEIASAHLEGFGSLKGVAEAKVELFQSLPATGFAIFNMDSPQQDILREASAHCKQIKISLTKQKGADVWAEDISVQPNGWSFKFCSIDVCFDVHLNIFGRHNIVNALHALAGVRALGLNAEVLAKKLSDLATVPGRLQQHKISETITIFDDSYNANPTSMKAAINFLSEQPGKQFLVMGDMGELGDDEIQLHRECGEYALKKNINNLLAVGKLSFNAIKSFGDNGHYFENKKALVENLLEHLDGRVSILVKGSRAAKMEDVIQVLEEKINQDRFSKRNLLSCKENNNKQEQI